MKKVTSYFLFPLIALIILIVAFSTQLFSVPPLGKLLDPFAGLVQNVNEEELSNNKLILTNAGLKDSVQVFFDDRKVPHIYAKNTHDLYFAQGYVTASLRLWQMDFVSYLSAGRLSEIFGMEGFLDYDRKQRRIGMLAASKKSLALIEQKDPETDAILTSYSDGVNAYIKQLDYKKLPLEYKLMDYEPEPWSKLKTVLVMKQMANNLTGYEEDNSMTNILLTLGEEQFNKIFPDLHPHISPVTNDPKTAVNNSLAYLKKPTYLDYGFITANPIVSKNGYNPRLGSNSWAVSGKKTTSGSPILCCDPHLNLTFPCVWLEMQLNAPEVNVYGVSIPGTPAAIIGFNQDIAWGVTNGATDVKDWYKLKINESYTKYEFDGKWLDLKYEVEEIKRKGESSFYDTVYYTVHGPVVNNKSFPETKEYLNYALRWEVQNPSDEFQTFIKLNKAKNYEDYRTALKGYSCPIQNFVFAGKDNNIAITHQGKMAVKWPGQGKFILDGTLRSHLYTNYIPDDSLPREVNPECNYVFSANQHPTASNYSYYYNGYYSETRANQINKLLQNENKFDVKKMEAMQLDNTNIFATEVLPVLLKSIRKNKLTDEQKKIIADLSTWNGAYSFNDQHAEFFELWLTNVKDGVWDEFKKIPSYASGPKDYVLLDMIKNDPTNIYFDKQGTSTKENADEIIREAFVTAFTRYDKMKKEGSVKWSDQNKVSIMHMTSMEAFSDVNMPSAGFHEAINAMSSDWGPSWRMVVELGDRPKAYGVYPGGQSGNVGSNYYDNFVKDWINGNYYPLQFYMTQKEAKEHATANWTLK
jgi:penicillin amidase